MDGNKNIAETMTAMMEGVTAMMEEIKSLKEWRQSIESERQQEASAAQWCQERAAADKAAAERAEKLKSMLQ